MTNKEAFLKSSSAWAP